MFFVYLLQIGGVFCHTISSILGKLTQVASMIKTLLADDDKNLRKVLTTELLNEGYDVTEAENGTRAIELLDQEEFDVFLLDLNMPGLGGMEVLKKIRALQAPTEVIILTAHATVSTAVEAMKLGAYDFLTKPFKIEELRAVIDKAYEKKKLLRENLVLKTQLKRQTPEPGIITRNPLMFEILETVKKVGTSDLPVLVFGESGVGKELVARAVHDSSLAAGPAASSRSTAARSPKPCSKANCSGMKRALSRARSRKNWASSRSRTRERCSSTR